MNDESLGSEIYNRIGERYSAGVDDSPYNAYYERPAMVALLPPLAGKHVLDVGSGNGWYAEYLLDQGAVVTAMDASAVMVEQTRQRVGDRAAVHLADLAQPLTFAADGAFDVVLCPLVLHYVEDWAAVFTEFYRVLRPGGMLLFSTHHPTVDFYRFQPTDYYVTALVEDQWKVGTVSFYRRSLTAIVDALATGGFQVRRIVEPQPTPTLQERSPEDYERLRFFPAFIVFLAVK